jgi:hypothetical protein
MPVTIEPPKQPSGKLNRGAGTNRPQSRARGGGGLKTLRGGVTAGQVAAATTNPPQQALMIRARIAELEEQLRALNVVDVPRVVLSELHDTATGRIDARKLAGFIGVPLKQLSEGLGLNYKAVHRSPAASGFQSALLPVKRLLELLHEFFGSSESIRVWLNAPHPDLDGMSALATILEGKPEAVVLILENAWNGVPA